MVGGGGGLWLLGAWVTRLLPSLRGLGVAGSSRSQESLVLAAPSSVASSVSAECKALTRLWGSTEAHLRSRSRSSRSSPS